MNSFKELSNKNDNNSMRFKPVLENNGYQLPSSSESPYIVKRPIHNSNVSKYLNAESNSPVRWEKLNNKNEGGLGHLSSITEEIESHNRYNNKTNLNNNLSQIQEYDAMMGNNALRENYGNSISVERSNLNFSGNFGDSPFPFNREVMNGMNNLNYHNPVNK